MSNLPDLSLMARTGGKRVMVKGVAEREFVKSLARAFARSLSSSQFVHPD